MPMIRNESSIEENVFLCLSLSPQIGETLLAEGQLWNIRSMHNLLM